MADISGGIPPGEIQKILNQWAMTIGSRMADSPDLPSRGQPAIMDPQQQTEQTKTGKQTEQAQSGEPTQHQQKLIQSGRTVADQISFSSDMKRQIEQSRKEAIMLRDFRDELEKKLLDFLNPQPTQDQIRQAARFAATSIWDILKKAQTEDDDQEVATHLLAMLMRIHSKYTYEHSERVMDWTIALAEELGIEDERELSDLGKAAFFRDIGMMGAIIAKEDYQTKNSYGDFLQASKDSLKDCGSLHDIGKVRIPPEILNKQAPLTEEEYNIIKTHPLIGVEIVRPYPALHRAIPGIRHHHEKWDGTGYPDGLEAEEIPLAARIIAVTDTFDAMTEDRPYRKGLTYNEALNEMIRLSGKQFDPKLVPLFIRTLLRLGEINPDELQLDIGLENRRLIFGYGEDQK